jgi:dephospho-CoA kinase
MSNRPASIVISRNQPPTYTGHGTAIGAAQKHAEETGGVHYIFPTHTVGGASDPLDHDTKVAALRQLFPTANIVSDPDIRTPIQMMKHLESKGHKQVTILGGGEEDQAKWKFLQNEKYRKEEYPGIKSVNIASAGKRDPKAKGAVGMSGTKMRAMVTAGDKAGFVAEYPKEHKELAMSLYEKIRAAQAAQSQKKKKLKESAPTAFFLIGGPGSGKDFVLKNTFAKYDLMEVQIDQVLNGAANKLFEEKKNLVINGPIDENKMFEIQSIHEDYNFNTIYVSVTNKVSRMRNEQRDNPLNESKRIEKYLSVEKLVETLENVFVFNNSMNYHNASAFEKLIFEDQTSKLEELIQECGIQPVEVPGLKSFAVMTEKYRHKVPKDKKSGLPKKYVAGLSTSTAKARAEHWKEKERYSDRDPRAYEPAPGDATAETKPSKHTLAIRSAMAEGIDFNKPIPAVIDPRRNRKARGGNITAVMQKRSLIKKMQTLKETTNYNIKDLIDTTKSITNQLSVQSKDLTDINGNKASYCENNLIWEAIKHPSSQRWYLTGNYTESNNDE